jgi:hypothetical protein
MYCNVMYRKVLYSTAMDCTVNRDPYLTKTIIIYENLNVNHSRKNHESLKNSGECKYQVTYLYFQAV